MQPTASTRALARRSLTLCEEGAGCEEDLEARDPRSQEARRSVPVRDEGDFSECPVCGDIECCCSDFCDCVDW